MDFTVEGRFDLVIPEDVREQYGIRLNDSIPALQGDNTVSLTVRRDADGVHVDLNEIDFQALTSTTLQGINLTPAAGDDQIVLRLTHAANSTAIVASFDLLDNGVVTSTQTFSIAGHAFDNENFVQAQFVASGAPETVSTMQGNYATLTVDQSGEWIARLRNGGNSFVQALAQGETATETFNVQVTDEFGASAIRPVTATVTGVNDAPVVTGGNTTGTVKEDSINQASGQLTAMDIDHGATLTWSVVGAPSSGNTGYHFLMDSFLVTKGTGINKIIVLQDDFSDDSPPPSSPPFNPNQPNQQNTTYTGIGSFDEADGKLILDSNNAVSFVGVGNPNPVVGQDAIARTNIDPNNTNLGLKSNSTFDVVGVFDLILPDNAGEGYGIRLTDRLIGGSGTPPDQPGNNVLELAVRESQTGVDRVLLRNINFAADVTTNLGSIPLNLSLGADQIQLHLSHGGADGQTVHASFDYLLNGVIIGSENFDNIGVTGTIFQGENWVRAELVASAPAPFGVYGNINIDQTGQWTYVLDNSRPVTQSLAEGQQAIDTVSVQVADEFGAIATQTISITVVGTNDGPIMQTGAVIRTRAEDSAPVLTASGQAQFSDADLTDTHVLSATLQSALLSTGDSLPAGLFPLLSSAVTTSPLDPATGDGHGQLQWNFALANSAAQFLAQGETLALDYHVNVTDPFGAVAFQDVTINITGVNDAPVIQGPSTIAPAPLQGPIGVPGQTSFELANNFGFSDVDLSDDHTVLATFNPLTSDGGAPLGNLTATLLNDTTNGTGGLVHWSYIVNPSLVNALPAGVVRHESFDITIDDIHGGIATEHVTITIKGPPPVVSLSPAIVEGDEGDLLTFTFTRTGDLSQPLTINYVVNDGPPLGGATRADGDFTYAPGMQQLTFAANSATASIDVQTHTDGKVEGTENIQVLLAGGLDYNVDLPNSGSNGLIHDVVVGPFTTVDYAGATSTIATDINDSGQVVGQSIVSGHQIGWVNTAGAFGAPMQFGNNTSANTINDLGIVGGYFEPAGSTPRYGFLAFNGTPIQTIDLPPHISSTYDGSNDGDVINGADFVGSLYLGGVSFRGFINDGGTITTLQVPGSIATTANGINDAGQVVGSYDGHGFLLQSGNYTTIDVPFATNTVAADINDSGQIVGWYADAGGDTHGFVYDGGAFATIDNPLGVNGTFVRGINDNGDIAGWYTDVLGVNHGFTASLLV
jgi:VCBS repeat-containing protein/probable HAF family extracellular repeat protein